MQPKSYGSSTIGGKKSTVCTSTSPRPYANTPASSSVEASTSTRLSRGGCFKSFSVWRRSPGPSLAAQPAHATCAVSWISMRRRSVTWRSSGGATTGFRGSEIAPHGHALDLHARVLRQAGGGDRRPGRRGRAERLAVDLVHGREIA